MRRTKHKPTKRELQVAKEIFKVCAENYEVYYKTHPFRWEFDELTEFNRSLCLKLARWHLSQ
jgi:hypothetical protein